MSKTCEKCIHHDVCRYPVEGRAYPETCWKYKEERPHGEWKKDGFFAICSECGHELQHYELVVSRLNFCPNCGADMREGEAE